MSLSRRDRSLQEELEWARGRLEKAGYHINSKVRLLVDPKLEIMGYASDEGGVQHIVIADWALDSEMLGGLLFHELAHIYHAEKRSPSHRGKETNAIITEFARTEGLNEGEAAYLVEGFSHLQNVLVDDIVFAVLDGEELSQTKQFFSGWVTESPSGYALADTSALSRNAFAMASLKRHGMAGASDPVGGEMASRRDALIGRLGGRPRGEYDAVERFLVEADADWDENAFSRKLTVYLDLLVTLLRATSRMDDLR